MNHWQGVFPAITTQMHKDGALDVAATARHADALIASGITGLVFLGSLGENQTLTDDEKRLDRANVEALTDCARCAQLACLAADGTLAEGAALVQESIVGSTFTASYRWLDRATGKIAPTSTGAGAGASGVSGDRESAGPCAAPLHPARNG